MNHRITTRIAGLLLALGLGAGAGSAWARNDKLLLPVAQGLRGGGSQQLPTDVALGFGHASAAGLDVSAGGASVHGVADPFSNANSNNGGQRVRRRDDVVCMDAFRRAVADLQGRARAVGAVAVVGIVSNYNGMEMDSGSMFECHIGHTRGIVDLRGQFTRTALQAPVAVLPVARAPAVAAVAPSPAPALPAPAGQPQRIASGFAAIDDIDAIPYLSDRGRRDYAEWLTFPTPRAFALSETGHYWHASGLRPKDETLPKDPTERALLMCERNAKRPCKLYAVNGAVVWTK